MIAYLSLKADRRMVGIAHVVLVQFGLNRPMVMP
jgi:hypothetical protein